VTGLDQLVEEEGVRFLAEARRVAPELGSGRVLHEGRRFVAVAA
jgi:hypothetical protein